MNPGPDAEYEEHHHDNRQVVQQRDDAADDHADGMDEERHPDRADGALGHWVKVVQASATRPPMAFHKTSDSARNGR